MDFQIVIVAIIVFVALAYVGRRILHKTKSFSSKSSCGADCGCGTPTIKEKINEKIEV